MGYPIILTRIFNVCGFFIGETKLSINGINKFKVLTIYFWMFFAVLAYGQETKRTLSPAFKNDANMAAFNQPELTYGKNIVGTIDIFDNFLMMDSVIFEITYKSAYKPALLPKSFMDLKKVNLKTVFNNEKNNSITIKMYNMQHLNNGNTTHFYGFYMDKTIEKGTVRLTFYTNTRKKYQSDFVPIL